MKELSKTKLQYFASLAQAKIRKREAVFLVEGMKSVQDTLSAFEVVALIGEESALQSLPATNAEYFIATSEQLGKITSLTTPPEVIAVYRRPDDSRLGFPLERKLYLLLDGVRDPGNMGTIIRTADWFGVYDIICSHDCADVYNPKCIQATMGSIGRVEVNYASLPEVIAKADGFPVYGTSLQGEDIFQSDLSDYGFIIMGNEGKGVTDEVMSMVNKPLLIPCFATKEQHSESLNVGVATGIVLAEFRRKINYGK